ncbi:hypothetical protein [Paenibacillus sp. QZ-Y1]|uniref:hypothetical protein n=1 Tax=Paenibacillus sp. QZ-Y1 TaxID=3414511 RepID=UPI003F791C4B
MREVNKDTLHLDLDDLQEIEFHLKNTPGASLLEALGSQAYLSRVTSDIKLPEHYTKIEVNEIAVPRYNDLVSLLEDALRVRNN